MSNQPNEDSPAGLPLRRFTFRALREALAWAAAGGQAVHLHKVVVDRRGAPKCFLREVDAGREIAHLFDQDRARLEHTVRQLGVKQVKVEREGTPEQHVDLCCSPLERALLLCQLAAAGRGEVEPEPVLAAARVAAMDDGGRGTMKTPCRPKSGGRGRRKSDA